MQTSGVGVLLKDWRSRRHLSQMALAFEAGVSPRHVSFVETGRSRPGSELILTLARHLDVPLRERNDLLLPPDSHPGSRRHRCRIRAWHRSSRRSPASSTRMIRTRASWSTVGGTWSSATGRQV